MDISGQISLEKGAKVSKKIRNDFARAVHRKKSDFRRHVRVVFAIRQSAPARVGREKKRGKRLGKGVQGWNESSWKSIGTKLLPWYRRCRRGNYFRLVNAISLKAGAIYQCINARISASPWQTRLRMYARSFVLCNICARSFERQANECVESGWGENAV